MSDIFLSYAREDSAFAGRIAGRLEEEGWTVFWDRNIPVGNTWEDVLESKLESAACIIVLWSAASIESEWVRIEAGEAAERGVLVPVFLEPVKPPMRFRRFQAADLSAWAGESAHGELSRLLDAIRATRQRALEHLQGKESAADLERPVPAQDPLTRRFLAASTKFYDQPLNVRQQAARDVKTIASEMPLEVLLGFSRSKSAGERVAAAIGIREWLAKNGGPINHTNIAEAVAAGLEDKRSRVRYRYVQLVGDHPVLVEQFRVILSHMTKNDTSSGVRERARSALQEAR